MMMMKEEEEEETNKPQIHFEGPEKRLLIWYKKKEKKTLRTIINKEQWVDILHRIGCEILSVQSSKNIDAYVLSESSLFVYDEFMMIKTCGQTTLLNILEPLKRMTKNTMEMTRCLFSRKNYLEAEEQHEMHKTWDVEKKILDSYFEVQTNECAYSKQKTKCKKKGTIKIATSHENDAADAWYTYQWEAPKRKDQHKKEYPITFEVLMHDLPEKNMATFFEKNVPKNITKGTQQGQYVTIKSGINNLIKGTHIDPFQFEPCGYSMNGLIGNDHYSTIHITPEDFCSYASFETNYSGKNNDVHALNAFYKKLTSKVLNVFAPGRFMITMYNPNTEKRIHIPPTMKPYQLIDQHSWFNGLVHVACYTKQRFHKVNDDEEEEKESFFESTSSDDE